MKHPNWFVPVDDGSDPIEITIRSERVVPPCVFVDMKMPTRLLTSLEACQLGLALQDASKYCGQLKAKRGRR